MTPDNIVTLEDALKTAASIAKELVDDNSKLAPDRQSQFPSALRSAVDHAAGLLDFHKQFTAGRPQE